MILVYCVTANTEEAEKIGGQLLEKQLCACVNIIPGMKSMYWWKGKIEQAQETVLLIKTLAEKYAEVEKAIKGLHSYETPAIYAFEAQRVELFFEKWLKAEMK